MSLSPLSSFNSSARLSRIAGLPCLLVLSGFAAQVQAKSEVLEISAATTAQLPQGKEADGIIGDFVLRNDRIEAVISGNLPLRRANMSSFDPKPSVKHAAPKTDQVKKAFINSAIGIAVGAKTKLSIPDHVRRMRDSLVMSRGYTESEALAQAMNFYARGKVTSRDDDYQPRKIVIRRRR